MAKKKMVTTSLKKRWRKLKLVFTFSRCPSIGIDFAAERKELFQVKLCLFFLVLVNSRWRRR